MGTQKVTLSAIKKLKMAGELYYYGQIIKELDTLLTLYYPA